MLFDQLSDDMKLVICNKMNLKDVNEFRHCSRNSNRLVLQFAKHLQCTKMIESALIRAFKLEWTEYTPKSGRIHKTVRKSDGFQEAVRCLRNRTIESLEVHTSGCLDIIRESNISARSLTIRLKWRVLCLAKLPDMLSMLRPTTLSLNMYLHKLNIKAWNQLRVSKGLLNVNLKVMGSRENGNTNRTVCIPKGVHRLSVDGARLCETSLNRSFSMWLVQNKTIEKYTNVGFGDSVDVAKLFEGIHYNMDRPRSVGAEYDADGEKIYIIQRNDGEQLRVTISGNKLEVTGPGGDK